jgi:hypothetical protein
MRIMKESVGTRVENVDQQRIKNAALGTNAA